MRKSKKFKKSKSDKPQQRSLTAKQKSFCHEYLIDKNATQAAIRAGYSRKTAGQIGDENLKKPEIQKEIERGLKEQQERTLLTADGTLNDVQEVYTLALKSGDYRTALKAKELLGKHFGLWEKEAPSPGTLNAESRERLIDKLNAGAKEVWGDDDAI